MKYAKISRHFVWWKDVFSGRFLSMHARFISRQYKYTEEHEKTFSNFCSKSDGETWAMIRVSKWYDRSFESIWNSKTLKQTGRDEKIDQCSKSLIKIAIRFYQIFDVIRDICALMTYADLCEILEIEIIAADSAINSLRMQTKT